MYKGWPSFKFLHCSNAISNLVLSASRLNIPIVAPPDLQTHCSIKMSFVPPPAPKSFLGRHRILAPTAGVRVSPLCLGAMNFGDAWKNFLGECSKETSFEMLDYFYDQGGNFIDTAVNYQYGESEQWLGEWMEKRGKRDEMVIATKFTGSQTAHLKDQVIQSNFSGNSAKNIYTSVERSLKNLRTKYIDLVSAYDEEPMKHVVTKASTTYTCGTLQPRYLKSCTL